MCCMLREWYMDSTFANVKSFASSVLYARGSLFCCGSTLNICEISMLTFCLLRMKYVTRYMLAVSIQVNMCLLLCVDVGVMGPHVSELSRSALL